MKKFGLEMPEEWANKKLLFFINGKWVTEDESMISVLDEGFVHGIALFEGVRAYNGSIFKLDEHLQRLERSANTIGMKLPLTKNELKKICNLFLEKNKLKDAHMRIIISPGLGYFWPEMTETPTIAVFGFPWKEMFSGGKDKGIRVVTSPLRKIPPDCLDPRIKSINYLSNYLQHSYATKAGADEALVLDIRGFVAEMPGANIFIVKNDEMYTPKKQYILEGITRATIIALAQKLGYNVFEEDLTLYDAYNAKEIFICGTAAEITPVTEVDGRRIGLGKPGQITKKLQKMIYKIFSSPQRSIT